MSAVCVYCRARNKLWNLIFTTQRKVGCSWLSQGYANAHRLTILSHPLSLCLTQTHTCTAASTEIIFFNSSATSRLLQAAFTSVTDTNTAYLLDPIFSLDFYYTFCGCFLDSAQWRETGKCGQRYMGRHTGKGRRSDVTPGCLHHRHVASMVTFSSAEPLWCSYYIFYIEKEQPNIHSSVHNCICAFNVMKVKRMVPVWVNEAFLESGWICPFSDSICTKTQCSIALIIWPNTPWCPFLLFICFCLS